EQPETQLVTGGPGEAVAVAGPRPLMPLDLDVHGAVATRPTKEMTMTWTPPVRVADSKRLPFLGQGFRNIPLRTLREALSFEDPRGWRRAGEDGIAEGEDAVVGRHQPISAAVGR